MRRRDDEYRSGIRNVPLFAELEDAEVDVLDATLTEAYVEAGRALTLQGHIGRDFAVIVEGLATVIRNGVEVERLGPGTFFGEHALLRGLPRSADVIALTPMRLLVAGPGEFERMIREIPTFAEQVREADRLRQRSTAGVAEH
jgi:voltage-gated potassium channel